MIFELPRYISLTWFFTVSLISNAIPYSTIPYLLWFAPLFAMLKPPDLYLAILFSALGASMGKLIIYFIGRGFSMIRRLSTYHDRLHHISRQHPAATFLVIFMTAALPLPDDVVYIPIGVARYNVVLFFIALFAGKLIITILTAIYGKTFVYLVRDYADLPPVVYVPLMVIATAILMYVIGSIDLVKLGNVYKEHGFWRAIEYLFNTISRSFLDLFIKIFKVLRRVIYGSKKLF
ncbi:MAG: VTT domain-containing protein [Desulfurococcaceae archaeon]